MSEPFIGEIRMMGFTFAPRGWAQCSGALLPIAQFTALFSLLGNAYGGDGRVTFGLPNLGGGRAALGAGAGPGLTPRERGETGGAPGVALTNDTIPPHTHAMSASATPADNAAPDVSMALGRSVGQAVYAAPQPPQPLHASAVGQAPGASQPHNNLMPFQALTYCIALQGLFPPRG